MSVVHFLLLDFLWLVTILWMVGDHHGDGDGDGELSLDAKFQACSTFASGRFLMVSDLPWDGG